MQKVLNQLILTLIALTARFIDELAMAGQEAGYLPGGLAKILEL